MTEKLLCGVPVAEWERSWRYAQELMSGYPSPDSRWQYVSQLRLLQCFTLNDLLRRGVISRQKHTALKWQHEAVDQWLMKNYPGREVHL